MSKFKDIKEPDAATLELIRKSGDNDLNIALAAQDGLAKALVTPLRQGVLVGDVATQIYEKRVMPYGVPVEFPVDILTPGEETQYVAYTNPGNGRIAEKNIEGDYVTVQTYGITSAIDWLLRHAREARWDIVGRAMQVLEAGFVKKMNDDGWHTLLSAAADRNILIFDADASAGQFTKRLVSLMKVIMRRNSGGNTASLKRGKLTDIYMSPEGVEDIRNWGLDLIDDTTRRQVFLAGDDGLTSIFGVTLHDLVEFGENQEYQQYFTSNLGASLNTGDLELVIGVDMSNSDSFLMPIKQEVSLYADPMLHRQQRAGFYGWAEIGFAVLDGRRVIAGSF
jgi:hypothetical protein